ncbi:MAG TPA: polynucleotide adenylyltransferase PcnB [Methylococcaceae bacterium]|nr:polynucleotide adenylyltransferase PcnB [Methylococcaceae bacterium]
MSVNAILTFLKNILSLDNAESEVVDIVDGKHAGAVVVARPDHCVSRQQVNENALKVLYRLRREGFDSYLVGGCVRDLLLGREPKDFDVVTNAEPEQIARIFSNCRLIGKRFRLAHVCYGRDIIEVATFRKAARDEKTQAPRLNKDGRLLHDNVYGTIDEDVWRRDFTINALYYNIRDFSIVDYVGGMEDHKAGLIRLIGDAGERFREDPVRMLRAVRFAVKLGFRLHHDCEEAIAPHAHLLAGIPPARLYDEISKLFLTGYGVQTFELLRQHGLFAVLFPATEKSLQSETSDFPKMMVINALENSDQRIADNKPVTLYFLFAALLWDPMLRRAKDKMVKGLPESNAYYEAASEVLTQQVRRIAIPRHLTLAIREVWNLQPKFHLRTGAKPSRLMAHPRFRAAYDFLVLRAQSGDVPADVAQWWEAYQHENEPNQRKMTQPPVQEKTGKPKRRKTYRKKAKNSPSTNPLLDAHD